MGDGNIFEIDLFAYVPTVVVVAGAVLLGILVRVVLNRTRKGKPGLAFTKQLVTFSLILAGIVAVLIALPIRDTLRGQLFTLFGIIISALIALSSSTFVGNAMAGLMLRAVRNFRSGDFIKTEGYFGRVSDRGLFHTEIQTIHRDLVTLPNMFLVNNPVTVTRSSGVFISGDVSLGYNISREKVEKVLIEAAENAGLEEPFVHILELGDFSVTYRIYGLLEDVKYLVSSRSSLKKYMLDALHKARIEIVSPGFRYQRVLKDDEIFIPPEVKKRKPAADKEQKGTAESIAFDKAEEAESLERLRQKIEEADKDIAELKKRLKEEGSLKDEEAQKEKIADLETRKKNLAALIEKREKEQDGEG